MNSRRRSSRIQYEKAKYQKKKLPPAPSYITSVDLERFKNELIGSLSGKETKVVEKPVERVVEKVVEKPVVVERVIEKVVRKACSGRATETNGTRTLRQNIL